jgi:GH24 family phage-related lysozyme (muramidase)
MDKITPEWLNANLPEHCKKYVVRSDEGVTQQAWTKVDGVWTDITEHTLAIEKAKRDVDNATKEKQAYERKLTADEQLSEAIDEYILNAREHLYD